MPVVLVRLSDLQTDRSSPLFIFYPLSKSLRSVKNYDLIINLV